VSGTGCISIECGRCRARVFRTLVYRSSYLRQIRGRLPLGASPRGFSSGSELRKSRHRNPVCIDEGGARRQIPSGDRSLRDTFDAGARIFRKHRRGDRYRISGDYRLPVAVAFRPAPALQVPVSGRVGDRGGATIVSLAFAVQDVDILGRIGVLTLLPALLAWTGTRIAVEAWSELRKLRVH
jgi:hypothetical protein